MLSVGSRGHMFTTTIYRLIVSASHYCIIWFKSQPCREYRAMRSKDHGKSKLTCDRWPPSCLHSVICTSRTFYYSILLLLRQLPLRFWVISHQFYDLVYARGFPFSCRPWLLCQLWLCNFQGANVCLWFDNFTSWSMKAAGLPQSEMVGLFWVFWTSRSDFSSNKAPSTFVCFIKSYDLSFINTALIIHKCLIQAQQEQPLAAMLTATIHNAALSAYSLMSTCPF